MTWPCSISSSLRALRPVLLNLLSRKSAQEWFEILSAVGIPCGPINDIRGGVELAEQLGLEPVVEVQGVPTVRNPIKFSATPARYDLAPPALDADREHVRAWLGLETEDQESRLHDGQVQTG